MERYWIAGGALLLAIFFVAMWARAPATEETSGRDDETQTKVRPVRGTTLPEERAAYVIVEDDRAGSLRLEGQVVTAEKRPVADAIVVLDSRPPRSTKTELDGSFSFDALAPRSYTLSARAAEGVAGPVAANLTRTSDPVILYLRPAGRMEVTVVDAARGRAVEGATVELRGADVQTGTTDLDGVAKIGPIIPGSYRLATLAPGYATEYSTVNIDAETLFRTRIALRRGASVGGRVIDSSGRPVSGAQVVFEGVAEWSQRADPARDGVVTGTDGEFRFQALPAGSFRLTARHEGYAPGHSAIVSLDGKTAVEGVEIALGTGAVIRGRVVSLEDQPIAGATIRIGSDVQSVLPGGQRQLYSDEKGRFEARGLQPEPTRLIAFHETGASRVAVVDLSSEPYEREVTLELEITDRISGVVVDPSGEPLESVQVTAVPDVRAGAQIDRRAAGLRTGVHALTDVEGRFLLVGLAPGPYLLTASPPGRSERNVRLQTPVPASTGDRDVRIVIEADGAIDGRVVFDDGTPVSSFVVELSTARSAAPTSVVPALNAEGTFQVNDLPPQTYDVKIRGSGFVEKVLFEVVVLSGRRTDVGTIEVLRGRAISGRVVRDGQPVPGATVRAGTAMFGDGASLKAASAPPGADDARQAVSDEEGRFALAAIGLGNVFVAADHPEQGRSRPISLRVNNESVEGVLLSLEPTGALSGKVRKGTSPMPLVAIGLQPRDAFGVQFGVLTGADGGYRFDRLAPGSYKVSALIGTPLTSMGLHSKTVTVAAGAEAVADLTVGDGEIDLTVVIELTNAESYNFAFVGVMAGAVTARTSNELQRVFAAESSASSGIALSFGKPVVISALSPGVHSICSVPYPNELKSREQYIEYGAREGDALPAFCRLIELTASPAAQTGVLKVAIPAFVEKE